MAVNGCLHYTRATVEIYFEPGHVSCEYCPMLETYARKQCRRTGEYIIDTRITGNYCPLIIEKENTTNESN